MNARDYCPVEPPPPRILPRVEAVEYIQRGRAGAIVVALVEDPPRCGRCSSRARATYRGKHGLEDRCTEHAAGRPVRELLILYVDVIPTGDHL